MGGFEIEMPPLVVRGGREETADTYLKSDELCSIGGPCPWLRPSEALGPQHSDVLFDLSGMGFIWVFFGTLPLNISFPLRRN